AVLEDEPGDPFPRPFVPGRPGAARTRWRGPRIRTGPAGRLAAGTGCPALGALCGHTTTPGHGGAARTRPAGLPHVFHNAIVPLFPEGRQSGMPNLRLTSGFSPNLPTAARST